MRPLIFGNGRILICQDERGTIRDIYYPFVGLENHGNSIKAGICDLDRRVCSWFESWDIDQNYKTNFSVGLSKAWHSDEDQPEKNPHQISNIGETTFTNTDLDMRVSIWDAVHPSIPFLYRVFEVRNLSSAPRNLRLFSNQNYMILENKIGETAVIDRDVLIHYKRDRYFLHGSRPGFDQFATGKSEWKGLQGTWRDMEEDGALSGNVVAQGSVDSTLGWTILQLLPDQPKRIDFWIAIGKSYVSALRIHKRIKDASRDNIYRLTFNFWRAFIERISLIPECEKLDLLPGNVKRIFYRSLLTTVSHMDLNGSVIASCDSDIKQFGADLYTYCWPRDAAWACLALDRTRYHNLSSEIFEFLARIITDRGCFLHKYTPAGDFGSTWHPVPMIQIDETALPLYALYQNWMISKDVWTIGRYYSSLVTPAADYLVNSLERNTGLPMPSYDLWEERKDVHIYSACCVYAGLNGASILARVLGNNDEQERWAQAADAVRKAIPCLYDQNQGKFKRSVSDFCLDASLFAVWYMGILPVDDRRVTNSMNAIEKDLMKPSGGIARYTGDNYQGYMNSWIICTLWLAQWHIAIGDLVRALELISWCADHSLSTGLMPEQVDDNGIPRSVLPLMWSHCTFVLAVMDYLAALEKV
jgi:GH15 family glucan-1,4-alpha-glucosidase